MTEKTCVGQPTGTVKHNQAMSAFRHEVRAIIRLAWPIVGAQLLMLAMYFTDNVFVARLGAAPLAAMAMATSLLGTLNGVCIGMLSPLSSLVSSAISGGRPHTVGRTVRRGLQLAGFLAVGLIVLCCLSDRILLSLGQSPQLVPLARQFLIVVSTGSPAMLGYFTLRQMTEGTHDTVPSMILAACAAVLNAVLDYILIYGHCGAPALGVTGAGLSTAICNWLLLLGMAAWLHFSPHYREFRLNGSSAEDGHSLRELLSLGLPLAGSLLAEMSFFVAITLLMGTIGVVPQASHQIALNAASFLFMVPLGLSMALAIRVGHARGLGDARALRHTCEAGTFLVVCTQLVFALTFLLVPEAVAHIYTHNAEIVALTVSLLRVGGVFQLFDGLQVATMGMLRGLLDTRVPFLLTMLSYWVIGLPGVLLLGFTFHHGPIGLWYGVVVGLGTASVLLQLRLWRCVSEYS